MRKRRDPHLKGEITELLEAWSGGDAAAAEELMPLVVDELRRVAGGFFAGERVDHTLQPTALVNEVFLELVSRRQLSLHNRAHFYGVAAQLMRRILVDHARRQRAARRGGDVRVLSLDSATSVARSRDVDLIALDEAMKDLARFDPEGCRVVELRFFAGLTYPEIAGLLGVPEIRIRRYWIAAKLWLYRELSTS